MLIVPAGYLAAAHPVLGAPFDPNGSVTVAAIGVGCRPTLGFTGPDAGGAAIFRAVFAFIAETGVDTIVAGIAVGNDKIPFAVLAPFGVVHHHAGGATTVASIPAGVIVQAGVIVCGSKL